MINFDGIEIHIHRKKIKNLYLRIQKADGSVKASVPLSLSDNQIRKFLASKADWINKKVEVAQRHPSSKPFTYTDGEVHYFKGESYKLRVIPIKGRESLMLVGDEMILRVKEESDRKRREKLVDNYYRSYLKKRIGELVIKWEPIMNVKVNESRIKKMKTRWGTCNISKKRVWINLQLAKMSDGCLESVVVHELTHLLERYHNKRFYSLMDSFYPEWRNYEKELKSPID